ncbi:hypothetical protein D3C75_1149920 [compost metagenome]
MATASAVAMPVGSNLVMPAQPLPALATARMVMRGRPTAVTRKPSMAGGRFSPAM